MDTETNFFNNCIFDEISIANLTEEEALNFICEVDFIIKKISDENEISACYIAFKERMSRILQLLEQKVDITINFMSQQPQSIMALSNVIEKLKNY